MRLAAPPCLRTACLSLEPSNRLVTDLLGGAEECSAAAQREADCLQEDQRSL